MSAYMEPPAGTVTEASPLDKTELMRHWRAARRGPSRVLSWGLVIAVICLDGATLGLGGWLLGQGRPHMPTVDRLALPSAANLDSLTFVPGFVTLALAWSLAIACLVAILAAPRHKCVEATATACYRAIQVGIVLLIAGLFYSGFQAGQSAGHFWTWRPTETAALATAAICAGLLHARHAGWLSAFGMAGGAAMCFAGMGMAWYGANSAPQGDFLEIGWIAIAHLALINHAALRRTRTPVAGAPGLCSSPHQFASAA